MRRAWPDRLAEKKTRSGFWNFRLRPGCEPGIQESFLPRIGVLNLPRTLGQVRDLYTIGVFVGFGVGVGVLAAALLAGARLGLALSLAAAAVAGIALGLALADIEEAVGAAVGGLAGAFGAGALARGALTRGGARVATAALLVLAALVLGLLALIPGVGYLEAVVLPALALRLRRTGSRRYAGLRILARD